MTLSLFAKEIPLPVTETEWGFEISNKDFSGKTICKGLLNCEETDNCYVVLKKSFLTFKIENLAYDIVYNKNLNTILITDYEHFINAEKDKKKNKYGPLSDYDSILIIFRKGKYKKCSAISDGKNLSLTFSEYINESTELDTLITDIYLEKEKKEAEQKAEDEKRRIEAEKKQRQVMLEPLLKKGQWNNDSFVYSLGKDGKITINAWLGNNSVEELIIPKEIEGLPVTKIEDMHSIGSVSYRRVIIPNTVKTIEYAAFQGCVIKELIFEDNSNLEEISSYAFADNEIQELNLPKKELYINHHAFSNNKMKTLNIFSKWKFGYGSYDGTFVCCNELETVYFEDGCSIIYEGCFRNCKNLKEISIPSSLKRIYSYAFHECTSLSNIIFRQGDFKFDPYPYPKDDRLVFNTNHSYSCFYNCPLPIKIQSDLMNAGLEKDAFINHYY